VRRHRAARTRGSSACPWNAWTWILEGGSHGAGVHRIEAIQQPTPLLDTRPRRRDETEPPLVRGPRRLSHDAPTSPRTVRRGCAARRARRPEMGNGDRGRDRSGVRRQRQLARAAIRISGRGSVSSVVETNTRSAHLTTDIQHRLWADVRATLPASSSPAAGSRRRRRSGRLCRLCRWGTTLAVGRAGTRRGRCSSETLTRSPRTSSG